MSQTTKKPATIPKAHQWTDDGKTVLILRRTGPDGKAHNDFQYPPGINVEVSSPDWNTKPTCGGGLHGWPWGMGLGEGADYDIIGDRWMVFAAAPADVVGELDKGEKCKFRAATKLYDGPFAGAWAMINCGRHRLIEAMASSGAPNVSSGYYSTAASSGNSSKAASSGYSSKAASSGDRSMAASSGNCSKAASSGDRSMAASSGYYSTAASSGNSSKAASSGDRSMAASSGYYSTAASSGDRSTAASSGDRSTAACDTNGFACVAGVGGQVKGNKGSALSLGWKTPGGKLRIAVAYVGEEGIMAGVFYEANSMGKFVEVKR